MAESWCEDQQERKEINKENNRRHHYGDVLKVNSVTHKEVHITTKDQDTWDYFLFLTFFFKIFFFDSRIVSLFFGLKIYTEIE